MIYQINVNRSLNAQEEVLNTAHKHIILAIQEPYMDTYHNTRATSHWTGRLPIPENPNQKAGSLGDHGQEAPQHGTLVSAAG